MALSKAFFDTTVHRMACSSGDFSTLYDIEHVNGQIVATFKRASHKQRGTEIFLKRLLPDVLLQEILEFVFPFGQVYQIRLLLEFSGHCRGYCYVNFFDVESARKALMVLYDKKIKNSSVLVKMSYDNNRLEIRNIPKIYTSQQVYKEVSGIIGNGLQGIFFITSKDHKNDHINCILTYKTHKNALAAKNLVFNRFEMFGIQLQLDWAIPEELVKSKRIYFNANPLQKLTKLELYEEITKYVKPKHILNIFLQNGLGYINFKNESIAYAACKTLNGVKMFGIHLKFSFTKFYSRMPNNDVSSIASYLSENMNIDKSSENSPTSQQSQQDTHNISCRSGISSRDSGITYSTPVNKKVSSTISTRSSYSLNDSGSMSMIQSPSTSNQFIPITGHMSNQQIGSLQVFPNYPVTHYQQGFPVQHVHQALPPQIVNPHLVNAGQTFNSIPYFEQPPIRFMQLNSAVNNNVPVNFIQMTQDYYRHVYQHY